MVLLPVISSTLRGLKFRWSKAFYYDVKIEKRKGNFLCYSTFRRQKTTQFFVIENQFNIFCEYVLSIKDQF